MVRFTNIFEEDFEGVKLLNFNESVNIIDVGASDGIASKFFSKNLNAHSIICYEPHNFYINILNKLNIKNLIIKPFAIGNKNTFKTIYYPRYKFFFKNFDLITYTHYDKQFLKQQISFDFKFKKNISIIKEKIYLKKIKKIKTKIDLIKIDVNGHELSVVKGLSKIIKSDKPALIIETNANIKIIENYLKKYGFKKYLFLKEYNKFDKIIKNYPLNTYFLQKSHLKHNVT